MRDETWEFFSRDRNSLQCKRKTNHVVFCRCKSPLLATTVARACSWGPVGTNTSRISSCVRDTRAAGRIHVRVIPVVLCKCAARTAATSSLVSSPGGLGVRRRICRGFVREYRSLCRGYLKMSRNRVFTDWCGWRLDCISWCVWTERLWKLTGGGWFNSPVSN